MNVVRKYKTLSLLSSFWIIFIFPQLLYFYVAFQNSKNDSLHFFDLTINRKGEDIFFKNIYHSMYPTIDISTLHIILTNSMVSVVLWLVSIFLCWMYYKRKNEVPDKDYGKFIMKIGYLAYGFFFLKEGVRVGMSILDFQSSMNIPYLPSFLTLILPHALFEFTAFISISILALRWLNSNIENWENKEEGFIMPNKSYILIPLLLIISAGLVETTLTPYLFREYLSLYI